MIIRWRMTFVFFNWQEMLTCPAITLVLSPFPEYEYEDITLCTVAGWGDTSENGQLLDDLQKVEVPIWDDHYCQDAYGYDDITDSMLGLMLVADITAM